MKIKKVDDKPMVIHTKENTNLHIAGRTGALATGAVTDQIEGGQEITQAAYLAYEASRTVTGTASKGAALFRRKVAEQAKRRIKKVEAGNYAPNARGGQHSTWFAPKNHPVHNKKRSFHNKDIRCR